MGGGLQERPKPVAAPLIFTERRVSFEEGAGKEKEVFIPVSTVLGCITWRIMESIKNELLLKNEPQTNATVT